MMLAATALAALSLSVGVQDAVSPTPSTVFVFDVWEFRPFYPGCVGAKAP